MCDKEPVRVRRGGWVVSLREIFLRWRTHQIFRPSTTDWRGSLRTRAARRAVSCYNSLAFPHISRRRTGLLVSRRWLFCASRRGVCVSAAAAQDGYCRLAPAHARPRKQRVCALTDILAPQRFPRRGDLVVPIGHGPVHRLR